MIDMGAIAGLAGIVVVAGGALYLGGRYAAARALNAQIAVSPTPARIGSALKVQIQVTPRRDVQVDQVEISLACHRRQGDVEDDTTSLAANVLFDMLLSSNTRFYSRRRHSESDVLCREKVYFPISKLFAKGNRESLEYEVVVPADGVGSHGQGTLTVRWFLTVRFDIPGFPDAIVENEIEVAPRYAA